MQVVVLPARGTDARRNTQRASIIPGISLSKSKAEFYKQLGLTEGGKSHDYLYRLMMVSPPMRLQI